MQSLAAVKVLLLIVAVVLSVVVSPADAQTFPSQIPLTGNCTQDADQLYMSGSFQKIELAFEYRGFAMLHDLGHYDICTMAPDAHYCMTYFRVMCVKADGSTEELVTANGCNHGPVLGLCVPSTCAPLELANQVANFTANNDVFQLAFGAQSMCTTGSVPSYCTAASYGYMTADCMDSKPSFTSDSSAVAVFVVILLLCIASVVCGAIGYYRRWRAEQEASQHNFNDDESVKLISTVNTRSGEKQQSAAAEEAANKWDVVSWFDLVDNTRDFFTVKSRNVADIDTRFFEGARTIAMLFVLFGHSMYFPTLINFFNAKAPSMYLRSYGSIGIFPAELAVDTFFFLSGFLMFHLYVKYSEKRVARSDDGVLRHPPVTHIPMMYLRRYLRMTPVVMLTMAFAVWLAIYIPNGVLRCSYEDQPMLQTCHQNWWHQLLYITNMHDLAGWTLCMAWFWYLSTDFQLFLLAPFLAAPYFFNKRVWFGFMACIIITIGGLQTQEKYGAFLGSDGSYYDKPWMRANPYIYGLVCAALVRIPRVKQLFASTKARWVSYFFGTALMVTCINVMWLGLKCYEELEYEGSSVCPKHYFPFMNTYAVLLWGLGMSLLTLPWATQPQETNGPIKSFLSLKPFAIASKLTFCCYMLHPIIIMIMSADGMHYPDFSGLIQFARFASATLLTFVSALVLHLVVEVPFAKMNDALTRTS